MSNYQQIVITMDAGTLAEVKRRLDPTATKGKAGNNLSGEIGDSLARYYDLLDRERVTLRTMFDGSECAALIALPRYVVPALIWAAADNAQRAGQLQTLPENGTPLVAKLRALSYGQSCALLDALERWHIAPGANPAHLLAEPAAQVTP